MSSPARAIAYAHASQDRFVTELKEFIRFETVSADPGHAASLRRCAKWLADKLGEAGLERVEVLPTRRHPLVYAEWLHAPERPTLLVYGHYDVQPPEPLGQWRSPPFEPVVRRKVLYGRGASDDKGQMFVHVKALEAHLRANRVLPVNVKCLFEGEEEIGSPSLPRFLAANHRRVAAAVAVLSDMPMRGPHRPAVTHALRGALSLELRVRGPERDLHSGLFGGAIGNPLQGLCEILASLHDGQGRVAVPGFYDRVRRWGAEERAYMRRVGPSDTEIERAARARQGAGDRGYTLYERTTIRPALTINGIIGGYGGPGPKAVIPATSLAKISFRLVPDQDPGEIDRLVREHVLRATPFVDVELETTFMARPTLVGTRHPAIRAAAAAYRRGFGASPVFLRSGGTIPAVSLFQEWLGIPTVLMGFALPDDRMHAPNEKFDLSVFSRAIDSSIWFLDLLGRRNPGEGRPHHRGEGGGP